MTEKPVKEPLVKLFDEACTELSRLQESLDESHLRAQGTLEHWAFKDVVCHIAFWTQTHADRLAAFRRGETLEELEHFLKVNDQVYEANKDRSLEEALEMTSKAYRELKAEVALLSEEDLHSKEKYPWTEKRSLFGSLYGEGFSHPLTHISWYRIEQGNIEEARRLNERVAEAMVELDDSPYARGVAAYNLACFYALAGEPARAVELLKEGLSLAPSLTDWSKEDSDLLSLHGLPEYEVLYS